MRSVNRNMIRYIAIVPMIIGHLAGYLAPEHFYSDFPLLMTVLTNMALLAPPVFFFFITEGFRYTHSKIKYAGRLLAFALVTQVPFCILNYGTLFTVNFFLQWNVIFTLFLGLLCLFIWESKLKLPYRIIAVILLDTLTFFLQCEWSLTGIMVILGFYLFRDRPRIRFIWFTSVMILLQIFAAVLCHYGIQGILITSFKQFPFLFLAYFLVTKCYNGTKGKDTAFTKWFLYILYPLHLLIIYLIMIF